MSTQSLLSAAIVLFLFHDSIWPSPLSFMVSLGSEIPQNSTSAVLDYCFCLVFIRLLLLFHCFSILPVNLPMDPCFEPFMHALILLLRQFAALANLMVNTFLDFLQLLFSDVLLISALMVLTALTAIVKAFAVVFKQLFSSHPHHCLSLLSMQSVSVSLHCPLHILSI